MSQNQQSEDAQPQNTGREPARRVFSTELEDATFTFKESDDDRAPVYALLPTGEKANRVFVVGTLTEVEDVSTDPDTEYLQARIVGPSGTFFAYAGQYEPEAASFLRQAETPKYVAVTAKIRTYETDEGEVNVALRPESVTAVPEADRTRWVKETASRTVDRIDDDADSNTYNRMVDERYDEVDLQKYKQAAIEAIQSVQDAGNNEQTEDGTEAKADAMAEPQTEAQ